jgi:hypothetical protein
MAFDRFCLTVPLMIPSAQLLSVVMGVAGWGHPISSSATRIGHASCPLTKHAAVSVSAAEAVPF